MKDLIKYELLEDNKVKFTVTVTVDEFNHALDHAFEEEKQKVEVKGFRKGQIPRNVFEKQFGIQSLIIPAFEHVANHKLQDIYKIDALRLVAAPQDYDVALDKIDISKDFTYTCVAYQEPTAIVKDYKVISIKKPVIKVSAKEVDDKIKTALLDNEKGLVLKDNPVIEDGDTAIFDFEGSVDGVKFDGGTAENYELVIGSGQFIPGFEDQMLEMKTSEVKDVKVTFPKDYQAADLAGKDAVFKVTVHEVKVPSLKELNDDFVKNLNIENVATVDEYKTYIKEQLKVEKTNAEDRKARLELNEKIISLTTVSIPQPLIDNGVEQQVKRVEEQAKQYGLELDMYISFMAPSKEEFLKSVEKNTKNDLTLLFAFKQIAKDLKITVSDEEIQKEIESIAKQYNVTVEQVNQAYPLDYIKENLEYNKAVEIVVETCIK